MDHLTDTVFALASAAGRAGVAVWRLSGVGAGGALVALTGRPVPSPRLVTRCTVRDPRSGELLDDGLAIWFPAPASFTGEDVAELHLHGGAAVSEAVATALASLPGVRPAEPGEFTRRAFEHGKMDLTAAEGLADLVEAETAAQRRQARRQMAGELGAIYEAWRAALLHAMAEVEAEIDFSDQDLPAGLRDGVSRRVKAVADEIGHHLQDNRRGEVLRAGVSVAILGPPNAGKSSLLNRLARRDAAIVSETAGTTRDVIEVHLDLGGYPVVLADTAGLRTAKNDIEREGMRRALTRAEEADLKLVVFDGATWPDPDPTTGSLIEENAIVLVNKIDLGPRDLGLALGISAKTGQGLAELEDRLTAEVARRFQPAAAPALTRARHRAALEECGAALTRFAGAAQPELAAEDLRLAARALGRITGRVDVEDVLDVIFAEFCIGK
jgi:tRNA modification GTPase